MTPSEVADSLTEVLDPELGVDIVSLGLVYNIECIENTIRVSMTTTSRSCPMGPALYEMALAVVGTHFPAQRIEVDPVFFPPWDAEMMDESARGVLGVPQAATAAV